MRPSSTHVSATLYHWAEFNQTCYITSPHGKGVREQHYFSVHPSICPSRYLLVNYWATKLATSLPLMVIVCESNINIFQASAIRPSVRHAISSITTGRNSTNLLHHFPSWLGCARATLFFCSSVRPASVHLSVRLSSKPLGGI